MVIFSDLGVLPLLLVFISLLAALVSLRKLSKSRNYWPRDLVVIFFWLTVAALMLFPNISYLVSMYLGLGSSLNTLIFLAFVVVFALYYKLWRDQKSLESKIVRIVQNIALEDIKEYTNKK